MTRWAGWIITFTGVAHTLGALTFEGAARHADAWFNGALRHEDLSAMSPAGSAYWLSVESFGPTLTLLGMTVLWLDRRGLTPPSFIAWGLLTWTAVDAVVLTFTPWALGGLAAVLLLVGARRAERLSADVEPRPQSRQPA